MLEHGKMDRDLIEIVGIESLVPNEHLLRKIDDAVDFNQLYQMVEPLYSEDNGRPSVDPVVLFKMVLIQHIYGLTSLRRTAEEVSLNVAYRWFLGYSLQEETPHFSTVSYNFRHRFTTETVDQIFSWILNEIAEAGYLSPKAVFIDGTHIKANANTKKAVKAQIPVASKHYAKELMEEVNADREAHGKKPFKDDDENDPPEAPKKRKDNTSRKKQSRRKKEKNRTITKSVTDADCGLFVKGNHKHQWHGRKFCVSVLRQSQIMARNQRAYVGQIPLAQPSPVRMDGMRAACGVNAIQISREYYFKGDQPAFLSENMISN